jgi:hypothetical protein
MYSTNVDVDDVIDLCTRFQEAGGIQTGHINWQIATLTIAIWCLSNTNSERRLNKHHTPTAQRNFQAAQRPVIVVKRVDD